MDKQRLFLFSQLFPGEKAEQKYAEFCRRKQKIMLLTGVFAAGIILIIGIQEAEKRKLSKEGVLQRREWNEGSYEIVLQGSSIYGKEKIPFTVTERKLTNHELEVLRKEAVERLSAEILNGNESLWQITHDVRLPQSLSGLPFRISWESGDTGIINSLGEITAKEIPEEGIQVSLFPKLAYEEKAYTEEIVLRVCREGVTEEELYRKKLQEKLLWADGEKPEATQIQLPETVDGQPVQWKEEPEKTIIIVIPFLVVGMLLLSYALDRQLYEKEKKRGEEIRRTYPQFVSKLQLLVGAGMTPRNAFVRIGREYERKREKGEKTQYLYEEVVLAGFAFQNGKPEAEVYRSFGRRCREKECRHLSFILAASLRQGNDKLLSLLAQETEAALSEQRYQAGKRGEEAGTKLLFPMLLMLMVVMFLILLPAMGSFRAG